MKRVGVGLGSLTATQLALARALLSFVLGEGNGNEGYDEWLGILAADDYTGKTTGNTTVFNSGNFYIAFLGKPSTTELWELQFGGHHFAFGNTYKGGKLTGATPSFRGVEPIGAIAAGSKSYRPMDDEKEAFGKLAAALSEAEKEKAKLSVRFSDVLLGPGKDGSFPQTKQGLRAGDLTAEKQKLVMKAIALYVNDLDAATAKAIMAKYAAGLSETYLSFSGSGTMNEVADYFRIDGPAVWVEYSAQPSRDFPGTAHPHSVWRDHLSDYGGN